MKHPLLFFAAAALTLAACSNDENLNDGPVELRLSSGIEVQTRATHNLDTQLKDGEQVHVWVDDATTGAMEAHCQEEHPCISRHRAAWTFTPCMEI